MHYHLLLADLDIVNTRQLSAAGVFGAQQWTPAFDAETIVYGKPQRPMPKGIQPVLESGALSPAVLVHELLSLLNFWFEPVHLHIHDLGLNYPPAQLVGGERPKWASVTFHQYNLRPQQLEPWLAGGKPPETDAVVSAAINIHKLIADQRRAKEDVVIAECVPGGTTTAGVWWRHYTGDRTATPSSSSDPSALSVKERTVQEILSRFEDETKGIQREGLRNGYLTQRISDRFQQVLTPLLQLQIELLDAQPSDYTRGTLVLGGGVQMGAVLLAVKRMIPDTFIQHAKDWRWVSTPWIAKGWPPTHTLPSTHPLQMRALMDFSLNNTSHGGLRPYEDGFVKEGLGLGAVLAVARDYIGCTSAELANWLDEMCCMRDNLTYGKSSMLYRTIQQRGLPKEQHGAH